MVENAVQRRLVAILAADVVGFSRLTGADEDRTLARLRALRSDLIDPTIAVHNGRVVKRTGDGAIVEFRSVVDAVRYAIEIQNAMIERNAGVPPERRIEFRIGIHLGDVVAESDGDLMGDGVNIAARLEGVAAPGAICLSEDAYRQVKSRLDLSVSDLGEIRLKNISDPMRIYSLQVGVAASAKTPLQGEPTTTEKPLVLSEKLSIAVLPFQNMSGDPEQEYFADGITEDIITELSRFKNLLVIARNSSFTFKGQAVDVKDVSHKLAAQYVVEGSVRKSGGRVRITAQLLEGATGNHLWAERYDRGLEDIFVVQDELVQAIAGIIPGQLDRHAMVGLRRKPPGNLTAYDCELRGRWALAHWNDGLTVALEWFEKAITADPDYAMAHAGLAMTYSYGLYVLGLPPETALARAKEHAHRAIALDDRNPIVNAYAAFTYHLAAEHRLARTYAQRAVSLNPNDPLVLYIQASTLLYAGGKPEEALEWFRKSERIEAYAPDDYRIDTLGDCYYMLGEYQKVVELHEVHHLPAYLRLVLAAALAQTGQYDKAKAAVEEYERTRPSGHDATTMIKYQVQMCVRPEDREHWLEGYRKAGLAV